MLDATAAVVLLGYCGSSASVWCSAEAEDPPPTAEYSTRSSALDGLSHKALPGTYQNKTHMHDDNIVNEIKIAHLLAQLLRRSGHFVYCVSEDSLATMHELLRRTTANSFV